MIDRMQLNTKKIEFELARIGWSQYRLAKKMGKKKQALNEIMLGKHKNVTLRTVNEIADGINSAGILPMIDPKDLLK